jgi:2,4-dienoyl-CoA reductase-like NADH-dependent reductase (Old Yellow Enzyme family)
MHAALPANDRAVTAARFPHLLSPLTIGRVTVRNRAFSSAHGTGFAVNGLLSERHIEYHRARARGGIGLIVIEATGIDDAPISASASVANLRNTSDAVLPAYRRIADAVHAEGAKIFCLLSHSGRNTSMGAQGQPPMAPSAIPMDRTRDIPHELEREEIAAIVSAFAAAARRCRDGGLDGVELSFTHGNLVQQFLSPASNQRGDEYGGSADNRLRLAREVLQAVRAAIGPDFTFGIRYSAAELIADGYGLEDGVRFAQRMVDWGALDYIDVSAGTNSSMWSRSIHYPTIASPPRPLVHLAKAVRAAVKVPVFCIGKLADPAEAEAIVAAGEADMVGMTRAHIAEPAIIRKLTEGRGDEIRTCIYCNESCFGRAQRVGDISCVYNPRTGREHLWPVLQPAAEQRRVLVIGGGPGGLEAARVAAKRGHKVELHERSHELGGQVLALARTPHRQGYLKIIEWLVAQTRRHGVDIRLDSELDAEAALARRPDAVVLATGSADAAPDLPGADQAHVFTARQVLAGANLGRRVVIGDWDGRHMGTSLAELLAERGHEVAMVSATFFIGMDIDLLTWRPIYERLLTLGVRMEPLEELTAINNDGVTVTRLNRTTRQLPADSVVLCTRGRAERSLYRGLLGRVPVLKTIGDAWAPRQLEQAIFEGARAAREI